MHQGEPPHEYVKLRLCREVYHCLPSQLDAEDPEQIEAHLICLGVEAQVAEWQERGSGQGQ
jgi:hypothetical protein